MVLGVLMLKNFKENVVFKVEMMFNVIEQMVFIEQNLLWFNFCSLSLRCSIQLNIY